MTPMRRVEGVPGPPLISLLVLSTAFLLPVVGGGAPVEVVDSDAEVHLQNSAFAPAEVTVNVNDTVTWTNKDAYAHDVTFEAGFGSGAAGGLAPGAAWSWKFASVGEFRYRCVVHSSSYADGMVGKITVVASGAPPPPPPGGSPGQSGGGGMHGGGMQMMWSWMALGLVLMAATVIVIVLLLILAARGK